MSPPGAISFALKPLGWNADAGIVRLTRTRLGRRALLLVADAGFFRASIEEAFKREILREPAVELHTLPGRQDDEHDGERAAVG